MTAVNPLKRSVVLHEFAQVLRAAEGGYVVRSDAGDYTAERALSCLVEPEPGDEVMLASHADGRAYVLAVLNRARGQGPVTLGVEGDVQLRARDGELAMVAERGAKLVSGGEVQVAARGVSVSAVDAEVAAQRMTVVGRYLQTEVTRIKTLAETFDSVVERISQRVKRVYRRVDEMEQLKVRHYEVKASETMHLHAKNSVLTAQALVKVDGEQIHMG